MRFNSPSRLWQFLRRELLGLTELCFPAVCPLCHEPLARTESFCAACLDALSPLISPCCPCCNLPFAGVDGSDHLCLSCLQNPPPFAWARAIGRYDGTLRLAVQRFKYQGDFNLDKPLAWLLHEALQQVLQAFRPDLLVAVPLHPSRLRHRSYNQALLLARVLGRRMQVPAPARLLLRTRSTPPQIGLKVIERRRNLRGAFTVRGALDGERILLIDDVMTTGATARECSRTLLEAGAGAVAVAVLARAARLS